MAENTWPFGPLDETIVHKLDELEGRHQNLKAQYAGWAKRLAVLRHGRTLPRALRSAIRAPSSDGKRRTGQEVSRATPLAVLDLVSTWLHFSRATEAEYKLRRLHSSLTEAETSLDALWAKLPDGMRRELDRASVPYSGDLLRPLQQLVSSLRTEMALQVEEWNRIRDRTIAYLRHNELKSRALDRSLKKAQKDPNYLSELLNKTYEHPEQLLDDLQTWQQVIQVWLLRAQQTQARAQSKEHSGQDKDQAALDRLWERRRDLAGQVLAEQWRYIAAELEPPTIHSIDQYLSAIEALPAGDANLDDLKQHVEACYHDVLKLFPVWLTTDLSTPAIPLQAGLFDCVVIDEACLCDIPSALPWLFRAKRIVVIGDERQLSYTVTLADSANRQFSERHDIGVGTKYDRSRSLFNLAADSVAGRPGQIALDTDTVAAQRRR
jgi:hypothetical protein